MVKVSSLVENIFGKYIVQDYQGTVFATYYIEKVSITEEIPTLCLYHSGLPAVHTYGSVSQYLENFSNSYTQYTNSLGLGITFLSSHITSKSCKIGSRKDWSVVPDCVARRESTWLSLFLFLNLLVS